MRLFTATSAPCVYLTEYTTDYSFSFSWYLGPTIFIYDVHEKYQRSWFPFFFHQRGKEEREENPVESLDNCCFLVLCCGTITLADQLLSLKSSGHVWDTGCGAYKLLRFVQYYVVSDFHVDATRIHWAIEKFDDSWKCSFIPILMWGITSKYRI